MNGLQIQAAIESDTPRVYLLGISGSLRKASLNRRLLQAAARELPLEVTLELWGGLGKIPPYNEDDDLEPALPAVAALREAVEAADGLLIATPEYNQSVPGQLKNALDWASRPWKTHALDQKPVAVIGTSPSPLGAASAQAETRKILRAIGARVVDDELAVGHAYKAFEGEDQLADEELRRKLATLTQKLVAAGQKQAATDLVNA